MKIYRLYLSKKELNILILSLFILDADVLPQQNGHHLFKTEEQEVVKEEKELNDSFDLGDEIEIQEVTVCSF